MTRGRNKKHIYKVDDVIQIITRDCPCFICYYCDYENSYCREYEKWYYEK